MTLGKADHTEHADARQLQILVVDDEELNRRMMRILLTRQGHCVDVAADGLEALDAVKDKEFDLVFMDLQMPTMDGVEASHRIRQWENGGRHTFIVALTASYLPEEGPLLFDAGIDNYISKPFQVEHIERMLSLISRRVPAAVPQPEPLSTGIVDSGVLDIPLGIQYVGGDPDTFREFLGDFLRGLPARRERLEQHLQDRKVDAISREAHNLKGIAANLGALKLAESAGKLDKQGDEGYTPAHAGLLLEVERAIDDLIKTANGFLFRNESAIVEA